ncbi:hypothetical protein [Bradyrhizobium sp. NC92]|uniref:hypothetical protein n=1 Tax=Bradyrhizobium sp. (strain NC92) TaxID=55395 RepID=UPI0021A9CB40|nr:hypothetical protein [Bradyrhizobium sp. NC92]UWU67649.1 hypothetical protein N2602_31090 [Bradyrhizobium sp. NC92]
MPVRHSRSQSQLQKSKSKPELQAYEIVPRLPERTSRAHSRLFVASTSRSAALKLLSDADEVCATWCLKIGRHAVQSCSFCQNSIRRRHEPSFNALQNVTGGSGSIIAATSLRHVSDSPAKTDSWAKHRGHTERSTPIS